jgi:hypothetical protein
VLAALAGDVGVVAVAQDVEDVVADVRCEQLPYGAGSSSIGSVA